MESVTLHPTATRRPKAIVRLCDLHKNLGTVHALRGLSFEVFPGEIVCLLGPNGAGKSTCIRHLLGDLKADRGTTTVFDLQPDSLLARRRIGSTPQESGFLKHLRVQEVLRLVAAHYPKPNSVADTIERFGLSAVALRKTSALSGGQRRTLALACAMIGRPELLVLDEPTTGLDPDVRRKLWSRIRAFAAGGGTVLITTHYLEEAEELADRVLVMAQGRVIAEGTTAAIKAELALKEIEFHSDHEVELPISARVQRLGARYRIWTDEPDSFVKHLATHYSYRDLEIRSLRMEDAFLMLIERHDRGGPSTLVPQGPQ